MNNVYELIRKNDGIPFRLFIHGVDKIEVHLHKEIEIQLILQGHINALINGEKHTLKENDIILLNRNETHSISGGSEDSICLTLQFDPSILDKIYPDFGKMIFRCKSYEHGPEEQEAFDTLRYYLAKMVWDINKKEDKYQYEIANTFVSLTYHLIKNFKDHIAESDRITNILQNDNRLSRIINQINDNIKYGITLEDIAKTEELTSNYLSHYIKKNLGISFQEYKNLKRLDIAVRLLEETDMSIMDVAFNSGFQGLKLFNTILKKYYDCSPSKYRNHYHNKEVDEESIFPNDKDKKSRTYLDVDRSQVFKKLFGYLELEESIEETKIETDLNIEDIGELVKLDIDSNEEGTRLKPYWKKLTGFSRLPKV